MEVALRAMNLLATFTLCRTADSLTADRLAALLQTFEQHGLHIQRNLEFSYLGNSNHYLTDLVGLLWLGIALPELSMAREWRRWALSELLDEMEQQILPDGANHEGATGYHRFVLELFLYSFILCRQNGVNLDSSYLERLRSMIDYLQHYLRPDGSAPLIGDTDGSQVLPLLFHRASEHSYLLPLGAAAIRDPAFKQKAAATPEIIWTLGSAGVADYDNLEIVARPSLSRSFTSVGSYIQRHDDLFLHFNLRTGRSAGRSSHCHNDLLSIEVAALGRSFIVDPGSYVYSADLAARHQFRSTAFHSTIAVDGVEQNTCEVSQPFRLGREARPLLVSWMSGESEDRVTGEHAGYERLPHPVSHRRSVTCYKPERFWLVEDRLSGDGEHLIASRFHFAADLEVSISVDRVVAASDKVSGTRLLVAALDSDLVPQLEHQFTSHHYGHKEASDSILWEQRLVLPSTLRWILIPVRSDESETARLKLAAARVNGDGTA
jgi:hypothetical protein